MKSALITYNSLDGATCGILAREAWGGDVDIYWYDDFGKANNEMIGKLERMLDYVDLEFLIIAGLPLSDKVIKWIDENWPKTIIGVNHHQVGFSTIPSSWLQEDFFRCSSDVLYFEFLGRELIHKDNGSLISFLALVSHFEVRNYNHELYGMSKDLNRLFNLLGMDRFIERSYFQGFTGPEKYALDLVRMQERRRLLLEFRVSIDVREIRYVWGVLGDDHIIEEAGGLLISCAPEIRLPVSNQETFYVTLLNAVTGRVHLFSDGNVDVGNIARGVGGYGSRVRAWFNVPMSYVVSPFKQLLNKKESNG